MGQTMGPLPYGVNLDYYLVFHRLRQVLLLVVLEEARHEQELIHELLGPLVLGNVVEPLKVALLGDELVHRNQGDLVPTTGWCCCLGLRLPAEPW